MSLERNIFFEIIVYFCLVFSTFVENDNITPI